MVRRKGAASRHSLDLFHIRQPAFAVQRLRQVWVPAKSTQRAPAPQSASTAQKRVQTSSGAPQNDPAPPPQSAPVAQLSPTATAPEPAGPHSVRAS